MNSRNQPSRFLSFILLITCQNLFALSECITGTWPVPSLDLYLMSCEFSNHVWHAETPAPACFSPWHQLPATLRTLLAGSARWSGVTKKWGQEVRRALGNGLVWTECS